MMRDIIDASPLRSNDICKYEPNSSFGIYWVHNTPAYNHTCSSLRSGRSLIVLIRGIRTDASRMDYWWWIIHVMESSDIIWKWEIFAKVLRREIVSTSLQKVFVFVRVVTCKYPVLFWPSSFRPTCVFSRDIWFLGHDSDFKILHRA